MNRSALRLLFVDRTDAEVEILVRELVRAGFAAPFVRRVDTVAAARAAIAEEPWDGVVAGLFLPRVNAFEVLDLLRATRPQLPLFVSTRPEDEEVAAAAVELGARDYIIDDRPARLAAAIGRELRDTETRRRDATRLEARKMEALARLAGTVAHDFNNLLTAMMGYADLLLAALPPGDENRANVEEVLKAASGAADLTRQLLSFSRKPAVRPPPLDLNAVVRNMDSLLRRTVGDGIRLVTHLDDPLGLVRADAAEMQRAIQCLAANARDAMPSGGVLTIATRNVELDEQYAGTHVGASPGPHVMLVVADSGIGMDDEAKSHLFEPFYTTRERNKGGGLGLATVYGIVMQSGGSIAVESGKGRGTVFRIFLPLADRTAASTEHPSTEGTEHPARSG